MPKANRHGQAEILDQEQLDEIFYCEKIPSKYRLIFAFQYYCVSRINEILNLKAENIDEDAITFYKANQKEKRTKQAVYHPDLKEMVRRSDYILPAAGYLFPGRIPAKKLSRQSCDYYLRVACAWLGFKGVSTHSFRRSAITRLNDKGVSLKAIMSVSGHSSLGSVQKYIEISEQQKKDAALLL